MGAARSVTVFSIFDSRNPRGIHTAWASAPWTYSSASRQSMMTGWVFNATRLAASISGRLVRKSFNSESYPGTSGRYHELLLAPSREGKVPWMSTATANSFVNAPDDAPGPESMLLITTGAATKVNEIRDAEGIEGAMALRLRVVGGGCAGFSYDLYFDCLLYTS